MNPARIVLVVGGVVCFLIPGTSWASRHRHSSVPKGPRVEAVSIGGAFGPPAPADLPSRAAAGEDIISSIEVVDERGQLLPAGGSAGEVSADLVAQACDEEDDGDDADDDLAEIPAESLRKTGTLQSFMSTVRGMEDLFRPKSAQATIRPDDSGLADLLEMNPEIPVAGVSRESLRDSFLERRGGRRNRREHLAIDIGAPRGTPVLAATDGEIVQIRREKRGGKTIYLRDASNRFLFYYCHLARYIKGLREGRRVKRGETLGFVGATGNAHGAHLHFSVTRLPDDRPDFHRGLAINPYLIFLYGGRP